MPKSASQSPTAGTPSSIYYDEHAAAPLVGVSVRTLQKWRRIPGHGPRFRKLGKMVRYTQEDIAAFLAGCLAGSTAEYAQRRPHGERAARRKVAA